MDMDRGILDTEQSVNGKKQKNHTAVVKYHQENKEAADPPITRQTQGHNSRQDSSSSGRNCHKNLVGTGGV